MGCAVVYIPRCNENICDNARFGITGLVIQIAESIWLSGTVHQPGFRIGGTFGDCFRLFGIGDRFIQQSCFQSFSVQLLHILGRRIRDLDDFPLFLCCISQNMRGICQQKLSGYQPCRHTLADHLIEDILKQGCPSEFPAAKLGNGGVIRNQFVKVDTQKPAESDVYPNLLLQLPLGWNAVKVSQKEHFHQKNRIDGRPAHSGIQRFNDIVDEAEIYTPLQIAKKMLFRHQFLQRQESHFQLLAVVSFQRFSFIVPYSRR